MSQQMCSSNCCLHMKQPCQHWPPDIANACEQFLSSQKSRENCIFFTLLAFTVMENDPGRDPTLHFHKKKNHGGGTRYKSRNSSTKVLNKGLSAGFLSSDNGTRVQGSKVVSTHLWNTPLNLHEKAKEGFLSYLANGELPAVCSRGVLEQPLIGGKKLQ